MVLALVVSGYLRRAFRDWSLPASLVRLWPARRLPASLFLFFLAFCLPEE